MKIIVQKFGGSSLSTDEKMQRAAEKIIHAAKKNFAVAVVVSAMGRYPSPLATDTLLRQMEKDKTDRDLRQKDLLVSSGEIYSCIKIADTLKKKGYKTRIFTAANAGIRTNSNFTDARILHIDAQSVIQALQNGFIAVVAGFQGQNQQGFITTLGRGGSDTSASALGAALQAKRVEIYTDVCGVMTADPKIYQKANVIQRLDFQEMGEMANEGAKVLHTRCVDIGAAHNLCIQVKSTFEPGNGTVIAQMPKQSDKIVTGLIHREGITEFIIQPDHGKPYDREQIFQDLARLKVSLDLINICHKKLYFSVSSEQARSAERYFHAQNITFNTLRPMAKIACVGSGMKGKPGVMAKISEILFEAGVKIYRSVDSMMSIACLIEERELSKAMEALHRQLDL